MQNNIRLINKKELKRINTYISFNYGNENLITSGTCETCADGRKKYHIAMHDCNTPKSKALLEKIGKRVKELLGADEVYYLSARLA